MSYKWIDISVTLNNKLVHWPQDPAFSIKKHKSIKAGDDANISVINTGVHSGTHVDAPNHFLENKKGADSMPFSAMLGTVKIIEIKDNVSVKVEELKQHKILKGDRIIFKTINSNSIWEEEKFKSDFVYVSAEAAKFLAAKKIKTIGIDYLSVGGYKKDGRQTHIILLNSGIWIIEGLKLHGVKPGRYFMACLPLKIHDSDGAPARIIIRKI